MDLIIQGIWQAIVLLCTFDPETWSITALSLQVSGAATLASLFIGMSAGISLALADFRGKRLLVSLINTGMGLPPVVVGLFVTIFLWRNGPLGFLEMLYTPGAIILAQAVIARTSASVTAAKSSTLCFISASNVRPPLSGGARVAAL